MPTPSVHIPDEQRNITPLSSAMFFILFALAESEKHGYAIMQSVSDISGERVRMGPATLYTNIQRLLELDLIEETESAGIPSNNENRRRYYKLTRRGKTVLKTELKAMESLVRLARNRRFAPGIVE